MNYYGDYYYNYSDAYSLYRIGTGGWLFLTALSVFTIICWWKIFVKAGEEGWKCLIPIYNAYVETKIVNYTQYFWFMLFGGLGFSVVAGIIIAAVGRSSSNAAMVILMLAMLAFFIIMLVMSIKFNIKLAHAFGKSGAFVVGLIFLSTIFLGILAFGDAQYQLGGGGTPMRDDEVRAWQCPQCGTYNPTTRDTCEKCGASRSGKQPF